MPHTGIDLSHRGQVRGNSGIILMKRCEVRVLSSFDDMPYADGADGAIDGLYPRS